MIGLKYKTKSINYIAGIVNAALFLYCFISEFINPLYLELLAAALAFAVFNMKKSLSFDLPLLFLAQALILSIYYGFYFIGNYLTVDVNKSLLPIAAYSIGIIIADGFGEKGVIATYFTLMFGLSLYGLLSFWKIIGSDGVGTYYGLINDNPDYMGVDKLEILFVCLFASFAWQVFHIREKRVVTIPLVVLTIVCQLICIYIRGALSVYGFLMMVFLVLCIMIYRFIRSLKLSKIVSMVTYCISVLLILVFVATVYKFDLFKSKSIYYASYLGQDGGLFHSSKYLNLVEAIRKIYDIPRKGIFIESNGINTSYSVLLDYARDYGIYVFGFLLVFSLLTVACFFKMLFNNNISRDLKILLAPAFLFFNMFYTFNSSAKYSIYMWCYGLIVIGMVCGISKRNLAVKDIV